MKRNAAALARSLPPAVRGFFLDGWNPHEGPPKDPSREGFLARVAERLIEVPEIQPDAAARAVFRLLSRRIDEGRFPDFRTIWPAPLRLFWPSAKTEAPPERPPSRPAAEKAMREIRSALEEARREGVPESELPVVAEPPPEGASRPGPQEAVSATGLASFDKTVQKTNLWLKDLMRILGQTHRRRAFEALRAVLEVLRDRMPADEAVHLGAPLPMILRGFYFEARDPDREPTRERRKEQFLSRVAERLERAVPGVSAEAATRAVFALLARHIPGGEIDDVRSRLPQAVRELWPAEPPTSPQAPLGAKPSPPAEGVPARARQLRRARARKARKEIRSAIARARAEGVRDRDLPLLLSRRKIRKAERKRARGQSETRLPSWYEREREEEDWDPGALPPPSGT